ncbi:hypothetical protein T439DRAFT_377860 [Meredithblackwellia eburnea MCA 4105]
MYRPALRAQSGKQAYRQVQSTPLSYTHRSLPAASGQWPVYSPTRVFKTSPIPASVLFFLLFYSAHTPTHKHCFMHCFGSLPSPEITPEVANLSSPTDLYSESLFDSHPHHFIESTCNPKDLFKLDTFFDLNFRMVHSDNEEHQHEHAFSHSWHTDDHLQAAANLPSPTSPLLQTNFGGHSYQSQVEEDVYDPYLPSLQSGHSSAFEDQGAHLGEAWLASLVPSPAPSSTSMTPDSTVAPSIIPSGLPAQPSTLRHSLSPFLHAHSSPSTSASPTSDTIPVNSVAGPSHTSSNKKRSRTGEDSATPLSDLSEESDDNFDASRPKKKGAKRKPKPMRYDPTITFPSNDSHVFIVYEQRPGKPDVSERGITELTLRTAPALSALERTHGGSVRYDASHFKEDCEKRTTYVFQSSEDPEQLWDVQYLTVDGRGTTTITPRDAGSSAYEPVFTFVHFPPGTMTTCDYPIGHRGWWRHQICVAEGGARHRSMLPESPGHWTCMYDLPDGNKEIRRPARCVEHFAQCNLRVHTDLFPLSKLARAIKLVHPAAQPPAKAARSRSKSK